MIHSPGSYAVLSGLDLRRQALLSAISLSAWWYAILAFSRRARFRRNMIPWASSLMALSWAETSSLLTLEPGILELLPNTNTSGEKPLRMLKVFFAWVHWMRACCMSWTERIGFSASILVSMDWRIWPCLSLLPFCQWAFGHVTILLTSCLWRNSSNFSLVNSVAESMIIAFGGPAHWNHASEIFCTACSAALLWCWYRNMVVGGLIKYMIEMKILPPFWGPCNPINKYLIVEIQFGLESTGSGNFGSLLGGTCWALHIIYGLWYFWSAPLAAQHLAQLLWTWMAQIFVCSLQHGLLFSR